MQKNFQKQNKSRQLILTIIFVRNIQKLQIEKTCLTPKLSISNNSLGHMKETQTLPSDYSGASWAILQKCPTNTAPHFHLVSLLIVDNQSSTSQQELKHGMGCVGFLMMHSKHFRNKKQLLKLNMEEFVGNPAVPLGGWTSSWSLKVV